MTTPDIAGLCERLRADTPVHNRGPDYAPIMVEPGPLRLRAADTLERQAAEIERLRAALEEARSIVFDATMEDRYPSLAVEILAQIEAALNQKGDER